MLLTSLVVSSFIYKGEEMLAINKKRRIPMIVWVGLFLMLIVLSVIVSVSMGKLKFHFGMLVEF